MSDCETMQPFAPPVGGGVDILFIAGEHSGDQHAARLARALLQRNPGLRIAAVGGPELGKAGAQLLFDLTKFSVVGLVEVLKHFSQFKALLGHSSEWIGAHKPRVVCLVDYPGFNLRLAKMLFDAGLSRKAGGEVVLFYYISPQIWAWKPRRRFEMARLLDALAVIFPFEKDCYADTGLDVRFAGHPFVTGGDTAGLSYDAQGPVLLLPGSRAQPVSRIFPAMLAGFGELLRHRPGEKAVVLYPDRTVRGIVESVLAKRPDVSGSVELRAAQKGASAKACLISSGTMSLRCALAGIPGAVCYRAHPLTYVLGRMLVKVPHLGIANLLLPDSPPYPEYIQGAASPSRLAAELADIFDRPARARCCGEAAARLRKILSADGAEDPAAWMLELAGLSSTSPTAGR